MSDGKEGNGHGIANGALLLVNPEGAKKGKKRKKRRRKGGDGKAKPIVMGNPKCPKQIKRLEF